MSGIAGSHGNSRLHFLRNCKSTIWFYWSSSQENEHRGSWLNLPRCRNVSIKEGPREQILTVQQLLSNAIFAPSPTHPQCGLYSDFLSKSCFLCQGHSAWSQRDSSPIKQRAFRNQLKNKEVTFRPKLWRGHTQQEDTQREPCGLWSNGGYHPRIVS